MMVLQRIMLHMALSLSSDRPECVDGIAEVVISRHIEFCVILSPERCAKISTVSRLQYYDIFSGTCIFIYFYFAL